MGLLLVVILSYLVGSFPTSIIAGRLVKGIDIRNHGSGNAGVTNALRVLGWRPAAIILVGDVFKGWLATGVLAKLPFENMLLSDQGLIQILAGFAAVIGHSYTIFAGFHGGKGIATLTGVLVALYPVAIPFCFLVFAFAVMTWGYVSVGSLGAATVLPVIVFVLPRLSFQESGLSLKVFSLIIPLFVLFTHRSNIRRLLSGTENRFEKAMIFRRPLKQR